jgi:predicted nucleic acid-binding protein
MIVVDTTVWIDFFNGVDNKYTQWLGRNALTVPLGIADLSLCELLQGFRIDRSYRQVRSAISKHNILNTGGEDVAIAAADNFRALRRRGVTIRGTVDCVIATFCIEHGHILLHNDRDFEAFEQHLGLQVLHPQTLTIG